MTIGDWIQTFMLAGLIITVFLNWWSTQTQNNLFKAQLLSDRFEMYRWTYEPVTDSQVEDCDRYPYEYMDPATYAQSYKGNPEQIRRYIGLLWLYEYLAFSHALRVLKLPDPEGRAWLAAWLEDLIKDPQFLEVHGYHRRFYPGFATYVDGFLMGRTAAA